MDRSNSMENMRSDLIKVIRSCLVRLPDRCKFNIISFGTYYEVISLFFCFPLPLSLYQYHPPLLSYLFLFLFLFFLLFFVSLIVIYRGSKLKAWSNQRKQLRKPLFICDTLIAILEAPSYPCLNLSPFPSPALLCFR